MNPTKAGKKGSFDVQRFFRKVDLSKVLDGVGTKGVARAGWSGPLRQFNERVLNPIGGEQVIVSSENKIRALELQGEINLALLDLPPEKPVSLLDPTPAISAITSRSSSGLPFGGVSGPKALLGLAVGKLGSAAKQAIENNLKATWKMDAFDLAGSIGAINAEDDSDFAAGRASLAAVLVNGDKATIGTLGSDLVVYLISKGQIIQLAAEHKSLPLQPDDTLILAKIGISLPQLLKQLETSGKENSVVVYRHKFEEVIDIDPEDLLDAPPSLPASQAEPTMAPLIDLSDYNETADHIIGEVAGKRAALGETEQEIGDVTGRRAVLYETRDDVKKFLSTPRNIPKEEIDVSLAWRILQRQAFEGLLIRRDTTVSDLDKEISSLGETLSKLESQAADIRTELGVLDTSLANLISEGERTVGQLRSMLAEITSFLEGKTAPPAAAPRQDLVSLDLIDLTGFKAIKDGIIAAVENNNAVLANKAQQALETTKERGALLKSRDDFQAFLDNPGNIKNPTVLRSMLDMTLKRRINLDNVVGGLTADIERTENDLNVLGLQTKEIQEELKNLGLQLGDLVAEGELLVVELLDTMSTLRAAMGTTAPTVATAQPIRSFGDRLEAIRKSTSSLPPPPDEALPAAIPAPVEPAKAPVEMGLQGLSLGNDVYPPSITGSALPQPAVTPQGSGAKRRSRKAIPPSVRMDKPAAAVATNETTTVRITPTLDETTSVVAKPATATAPAAPAVAALDEATRVASPKDAPFYDLGQALTLVKADMVHSMLSIGQTNMEKLKTTLGDEIAKAIKAALETNLTEEALRNSAIELLEDKLAYLKNSGGPLGSAAAEAYLAFREGKIKGKSSGNG